MSCNVWRTLYDVQFIQCKTFAERRFTLYNVHVYYSVYIYITLYKCTLYKCTLYKCTLYKCTLYKCILYNVQFTSYFGQNRMYSVHCTLYIVMCTLVHYTLYKCTLFTVQVYTVHCTLYTMNNVVYTIMCNNVHGVYIKTIIISNTVICTLQYTVSAIKNCIYIYNVHFTYSLYNIQCTLYIAHFIMYSVHCTVYSV